MNRALEIARARQAQAEANRAAFPFAKQIVDELKAEGFTPRLVRATEGARTIGPPADVGVPATWWRGMTKTKGTA